MRITRLTALTSMLLLLAFGSGTALAQSTPSSKGYDESLGVIGEIQSEEPTPPPTTQREGDLPFTGFDLGIVAIMGVALLGTGIVLRRSTRRSPTA